MKKVLVLGDGVTPTGFSRVIHSIFENLPEEKYEVHQIAVNYYGDPHPYRTMMYPASLKGDVYGVRRIPEFINKGIDLIFILNDLWIVDMYLDVIKNEFKEKVPPIVVYYPVDGENLDPGWFRHFDVVHVPVAYTNFGYKQSKMAFPEREFLVIPHGVDTKTFYKLPGTKEAIKRQLYPDKPDFYDNSFIVLNGNRNQPRKHIDISIKGFALFAEGKPNNVKYYHHAGITDVGWDAIKLAKRFGMEERLIVSNLDTGVQKLPEARLNLIYNATDVGLNTSTGEGWGLVNTEHAATGAVQVVPGNSASQELFEDCGMIIPSEIDTIMERTNITAKLVLPEDVASILQTLYEDRILREELSDKCYTKFSNPQYSWKNIAKMWDSVFDRVLS